MGLVRSRLGLLGGGSGLGLVVICLGGSIVVVRSLLLALLVVGLSFLVIRLGSLLVVVARLGSLGSLLDMLLEEHRVE